MLPSLDRWYCMTDKPDIINQFGRVSHAYASSNDFASGDDLDILMNLLKPDLSMTVLDVATGAGHTAVKIAPHVRHVVAIDITPEMIDRTQEIITSQKIKNVTPMLTDAEALSFSDGLFDAVTVRFAPHHFGDVKKFLSETSRILKAGGSFVIEDVSSPLDMEQDKFINEINKIRDPTHHRSYNPSEWKDMLEKAGFQVQLIQNYRRTYDLKTWLERAGADEIAKTMIQKMCYSASDDIKSHFEIPNDKNVALSFTEDNVIILSKV